MGFRIDDARTFTKQIVLADGQTFTVTYNARADSAVAEYDLATAEGERQFLRDSVADIADVEDTDGKPIAFSAELLDRMMGFADLRLGLLRGYRAGVTSARTGN